MAGFPITAYTSVNALGAGTPAVLAALRQQRTGLRRVSSLAPFLVTCGVVSGDLDPLPASLRDFDTRQARLACHTLDGISQAVARASARWGADRVGIVIGTSTGGIAATESAYAHRRETLALPEHFDVHRSHSMQATIDVLRARAGIRGPGWIVSTACSSSGKVFGTAERLLQLGIVDAVIVGGIDTLCQMTVRGFHALEVLSAEPCRPFGVARNGINLGEGGALLLVERFGDAPARLLAVGESSDAHHMTAPHPEGIGAKAAMSEALVRAGIDASEVSHVNAHATGTKLNDSAEALAIESVLGSAVPVVATKGYTGHTLGAAGAVEAVLAIMTIERGFLPASLGAEPVDPHVGISVVTDAREYRNDVVLSNSFAFGGSNVTVAIGGPDR